MNTTRAHPLRTESFFKKAVLLIAAVGVLFRAANTWGADVTLPEYQVKALFLLNFIKYVDWPPAAAAETNRPVIIGICGEDRFGETLEKAVADKTVAGRRIVVQRMAKEDDLGKCQILFISASERGRLREILEKIKSQPVLTVSETDQFMEQGGVINFVKKEGKIRLEINLDAARQARLQISSKLLNVADVVKGNH